MSSENKIALHTSFWPNSDLYPSLSDKFDRLYSLNEILVNASNYQYETDIFIHENRAFDSVKPWLIEYSNGQLNFIKHDISKLSSPLHMPFLSRKLLYEQKDRYDIFMYIESDIGFTQSNLNYWLKYKDECIQNNCNLAFARTEVDDFPFCDLYWVEGNRSKLKDPRWEDTYLSKRQIGDKDYLQIYSYWAGWIYDKKEFNKWAQEDLFHLQNKIDQKIEIKHPNYKDRSRKISIEDAAWGYHCPIFDRYKTSAGVIPIIDKKIPEGCLVNHMTSNFLASKRFSVYKIKDVFPPLQRDHGPSY